jgi:hypothetical protein
MPIVASLCAEVVVGCPLLWVAEDRVCFRDLLEGRLGLRLVVLVPVWMVLERLPISSEVWGCLKAGNDWVHHFPVGGLDILFRAIF